MSQNKSNVRILPNYGFLETTIPDELFQKLLFESKYAESKNPEMVSGITATDVAKHKYVVDSKKELINYVQHLVNIYNSHFSLLESYRILTENLPFYFNKPWFNFQRKGEYVPYHTHDGIYAYSLWLKIPKKCQFEFHYTNIIGNMQQHKIELTKKDEGKIIFFPSTLPHVAYPFNGSQSVRISVSGNVSLNSNLLKYE